MDKSSLNRVLKSDKGYTLVELIVIMAIIVTLTGVMSLGIPMIFSRDGERVARTIDDQIAEVRSSAMSKPGSFSILIHTTTTGAGNYIEVEKTELVLAKPTAAPLGGGSPDPAASFKKRIDFDRDATIVFGKQGSLPATPSAGTITISFDKSNGSVVKITDIDGTEYENAALNSVFEIKCTGVRNKKNSSSVLLMPVTGRHYIE